MTKTFYKQGLWSQGRVELKLRISSELAPWVTISWSSQCVLRMPTSRDLGYAKGASERLSSSAVLWTDYILPNVSLQNCEEINCFFNHPVCGVLLEQPELTNTSSRAAVCFWNLTRNDEFPRTFFISVLVSNGNEKNWALFAWLLPRVFLLLFLLKKIPFHRHVPIWAIKGELPFSICFLSLLHFSVLFVAYIKCTGEDVLGTCRCFDVWVTGHVCRMARKKYVLRFFLDKC